MSFPLSVGDFLAVAGLIKDIISCLNEVSGSKSEYQELIRQLELLDRTLCSLDKPKDNSTSPQSLASIKCAALYCRVPLEQFLAKIRKYETSLGPIPKDNRVIGAWKKITWLGKQNDIARLTSYLDTHIGILNILVTQHGISLLNIQSEVDNCKQEEIKRSLEESSALVTTLASDKVMQKMKADSLADLVKMAARLRPALASD